MGCKKVLEALDIVTSSFALAQGRRDSPRQPMARACDAFCWQLEAELYRLFDRILFINEEESRIVEPLCPGKTVAVPPMMPWEQLAEDDDSSKKMFEPSSSGSLDLIFVGSSAPLNVDGFKFFYYKIFVPYLRKHKVTVGVVGSVCDHLKFDDFYVTKFGNIPGDLRGYYERSKVVIIPILGGSGLSIKTIECLASGRAVVTSPMGAGTAARPRVVRAVRHGSRPSRRRGDDPRLALFRAKKSAHAETGPGVLSGEFRP